MPVVNTKTLRYEPVVEQNQVALRSTWEAHYTDVRAFSHDKEVAGSVLKSGRHHDWAVDGDMIAWIEESKPNQHWVQTVLIQLLMPLMWVMGLQVKVDPGLVDMSLCHGGYGDMKSSLNSHDLNGNPVQPSPVVRRIFVPEVLIHKMIYFDDVKNGTVDTVSVTPEGSTQTIDPYYQLKSRQCVEGFEGVQREAAAKVRQQKVAQFVCKCVDLFARLLPCLMVGAAWFILVRK